MRESTSGFALCETDGSLAGLSSDQLDSATVGNISELGAYLNHGSLWEQYLSFINSGLTTQSLAPQSPSDLPVSFHQMGRQDGALILVEWGPEAARSTWRSLAEIGSMTAMFIHELRNQLGGLKLYATFLRKQLAEAPVEQDKEVEITDKILQSINLMTDYSGLLSRLARPVKLNLERADIRSLIDAAVYEGMAQAREKGVSVNVTELANPSPMLDRSQLIRALNAVISRAICSSAEGRAVEIVLSEEREQVVLKTEYEGAAASKIRADRPQTVALLLSNGQLTEATLELAMAERVATAHGGNLEVSHTGDAGTCITFRLPVSQLKEPA